MTARGAESSVLLLVAGDGADASLARDLESLGFRVVGATSAGAAVPVAVASQPDVCVVLEQAGAADHSALEACRLLKRDSRTATLPVVVVSSGNDQEAHARATDAGADDVVPTAYHPAMLGSRIRTLQRLRRATEALDESGRRTRELEKVRDDLMKMIVHDLKTPLTTLLATLEILADGDLGAVNEEQGKAIGEMAARGNELLGLIDDLLQVWRIESTSVPLEPVELVPQAFIDDVLRDWEYRFRQENARVDVQVAPDTKTFKGDRGLLRRVFGNLIQNALTHSPAPIALRVSARRDRRGVLFTVADSGTGIPPEYHEVIFRKFHRIPRPGDARVRGSGLGLAFCRLAVEAHGGRIWVQSEEGSGSAFHVLLPLDPATALMRRAWNL